MAEFSKATEGAAGNIDTLKKMRDALIGGETISVGDLNKVLELYPQLFSMIGDQDAFLGGLDQGIKDQTEQA